MTSWLFETARAAGRAGVSFLSLPRHGRQTSRLMGAVLLLAGIMVILGAGVGCTDRSKKSGGLEYTLTPGRVLVYQGRTAGVSGNLHSARREEIRVVMGGTDAEGLHEMVVLQRGTGFVTTPEGAARAEEMVSRVAMRESLSFLLAGPRGVPYDGGGDALRGLHLFPRLPDAEELKAGKWEFNGWVSGGELKVVYDGLKPAGPPRSWVFRGRFEDEPSRLMGVEYRMEYGFDPASGALVRARVEALEGGRRVLETVYTLQAVEQIPVNAREQLFREAAVLREARAHYADLLRSAATQPAEAATIYAHARSEFEKATKGLGHPHVRRVVADHLGRHATSCEEVNQTVRQSMLRGQRAPVWQVKDLEGRTHSAASLRGKVVMLVFWQRRQPWCMRMLPQVEELARRYAGRPVSIIGINADREPEDARIAATNLGLGFPNASAPAVARDFGVFAYPTTVLIDPQGFVRDIRIGHSDRMAGDLALLLDALLEEKPAGGKASR